MRYNEYVYKMLYKHAPTAFFDDVVRLPVFRFTEKDLEWVNKYPEDEWKIIATEIFSSISDKSYLEILPFRHMLVVLDEGLYSIEFGSKRKDSEDLGILLYHYTTPEQQKLFYQVRYFWTSTVMSRFNLSDSGEPVYSEYSAVTICHGKEKSLEVISVTSEDFSVGVYEAFKEQSDLDRITIAQIIKLFMDADAKHLIEVKPKKDPRTQRPHHRKRHSWRARVPKHHYIYLDAPPSDLMPCHPGTGKPLTTGHRRRAHWRTLRDERFKKHPHYMRRIRIREAWIGPKTWSDSGAVYTVMDEEMGT